MLVNNSCVVPLLFLATVDRPARFTQCPVINDHCQDRGAWVGLPQLRQINLELCFLLQRVLPQRRAQRDCDDNGLLWNRERPRLRTVQSRSQADQAARQDQEH